LLEHTLHVLDLDADLDLDVSELLLDLCFWRCLVLVLSEHDSDSVFLCSCRLFLEEEKDWDCKSELVSDSDSVLGGLFFLM
jgi:hypothetical protein